MYSDIPNVRNGIFSEMRYAGATTIETPKFAAVISAAPHARNI